MNVFTTGVKEITRRLRRQKNRLALAGARKALEDAEIALGRSSWRELAKVDNEAVQAPLAALRLLDGELAENAVHIVDLEKKIRDYDAERDLARKETQERLASLEEEKRPVQQAEQETETRLKDQQNLLREHDRKVAELEAEQNRLLRESAQLQAEPSPRAGGQAPADEAARVREMRRREIAARRTAIPEQLSQLSQSRVPLAAPVTELEAELRKQRARLQEADRQMQAARGGLASKEKAVTSGIAACNREIAVSRRKAVRIEDAKEEPHRVAGQCLADLPEPPASDGGAEFYEKVQKHRQAVNSLAELEATWTRESQEADRQDLRIFRFIGVTCAVLIALCVLLIVRTPAKRDYLPESTETIVSINIDHFTAADYSRSSREEQPEAWQQLWTSLVQTVSQVKQIDIGRQVTRITHAMAPGADGASIDYVLLEMRSTTDVESLTHKLYSKASGYSYHYVNGLVIYESWKDAHPGICLAQLGPKTLALGTFDAVRELVGVRLGLRMDLKVDTQFLNAFSRLDDGSSFRLMTLRPARLSTLAEPLLTADLLDNCKLLGMAIDLQAYKPMSAMLLIDTESAQRADHLAGLLRASPEQVLQLQSVGPNLFIEPPIVVQHDRQVRWQFKMTSPAAREFLQRVSRLGLTGPAQAVARRD